MPDTILGMVVLGTQIAKAVSLCVGYFETIIEKKEFTKLHIALTAFEHLQQVSLNGLDSKLIGAVEAHLSFISLFKCLELKFKNAFPILIDKFESCLPFITVGKTLSPIV